MKRITYLLHKKVLTIPFIQLLAHTCLESRQFDPLIACSALCAVFSRYTHLLILKNLEKESHYSESTNSEKLPIYLYCNNFRRGYKVWVSKSCQVWCGKKSPKSPKIAKVAKDTNRYRIDTMISGRAQQRWLKWHNNYRNAIFPKFIRVKRLTIKTNE